MPKENKLQISYFTYSSIDELSEDEKSLFQHADAVALNAYAPYSNFKVGAAILLENGEVISGSNQENMAYPSGICAERTAIFFAKAKFPNQSIQKIAISCISDSAKTTDIFTPCGACRQVLHEYEQIQSSPIQVFLKNADGSITKFNSITDLLPLGFKVKGLSK